MKKYLCVTAVILVSMLSFVGCGNNNPATEKTTAATTEDAAADSTFSPEYTAPEIDSDKPQVEIKIKDYGTVKVQLEPSAAPITVENFEKLVNDGFYDGLTFHRIIYGFMMQGGDPNGNGTGGSEENIKGEFTNNGVDNSLKHTRGAISMARSTDMDSASSQFFIVHQDSLRLDGDYAVFGYVTEGIDIVDKICTETKVQDSNGTTNKEDQPIIESIKMIK